MKRVMVNLTELELTWLDAEAKRQGLSRSDLLRRIVDDAKKDEGEQ